MGRVSLGLLVVATLAGGVVGRSDAGELAPSVGVGLVDPNGAGSALCFSLNARSTLGERAVLEPELGYWSRKDSSPGVDSALSDASVGVNVLYRIRGKSSRARTRVFAGAGIGAHVVRSEAIVAGYDEVRDTEIKQAMHLLVTADRRIGGSLRFFVTLRSDLVADLPQSKILGGIQLGR